MAKGSKGGGSGIHIKPSKVGSFRALTHTPEGKNIPESKIKAKEKSPDPAVRKKAQFADNARKWKH